jgi:hypothetical protein
MMGLRRRYAVASQTPAKPLAPPPPAPASAAGGGRIGSKGRGSKGKGEAKGAQKLNSRQRRQLLRTAQRHGEQQQQQDQRQQPDALEAVLKSLQQAGLVERVLAPPVATDAAAATGVGGVAEAWCRWLGDEWAGEMVAAGDDACHWQVV